MGKQLRIPRVTQEFFPVISGPANQAAAIARGLMRCAIASPIWTTTSAHDPQTADLTIHRFTPVVALPNFRVAPKLGWHLTQEPADLLHVHGWRNPASDTAIRIAQQRALPLVVQAHGIAFGHQFARESGLVRIARRAADALIRPRVTRYASAVVAATRQEAGELQRYGFPADRIVQIAAGIAAQFFLLSQRHMREHITLLTVGRLGPLRNLEQIIRALAMLRGWGLQVRLRIIGPEVSLAVGQATGYRASLETLAFECGIGEAVVFDGEQRGQQLVAAYRDADIFVCASQYENFGQPRAEAAAMGLPLVATPTGIAADLLDDGAAGVLFPVGDAAALASALRPLCERAELRYQMGAVAGQRARAWFDWQQIVPRYVALYESLIHSTQKATPCR